MTDRQITVTGIKRIGGLVEVRISTGVPPAANLGGTSVAPPAVTGMIVPDLRLTFEDVEYTGVEILGAASPNRPIVCCGTPINTDDMEVVGTGIQHNPDGDATVQVYRPKADGTTDVYTVGVHWRSSKAAPLRCDAWGSVARRSRIWIEIVTN